MISFKNSALIKALRSAIVLLSFFLTVASLHSALVSDFDDIEFWAGSGANQAAVVIQWNDGDTPTSLVWGYRWESLETPTVQTMMLALDASDIRLTLTTFPSGPGIYLDGISYNQAGLSGFSSVVRDQSGYSASSEFWALYELGVASTWSFGSTLPADFGMGGINLSSNGWYGWSYTAAYNDDFDAVAFTFAQPFSAVPEPATGILLVSGLVLVALRSRGKNAQSRI